MTNINMWRDSNVRKTRKNLLDRRKKLQRPEIYIEFESLANRIIERKRLAKDHKRDLNERL